MSNTKDPLGILVEEPKNSDPLGILGGNEKKNGKNELDTSSPPLLPTPILPGTGAQESGSESGSPKYEYKWSDSQPLKTASVAPHPTKATSKIGTVSQNTATAALAHPDLYSKKENREQYISTLDLPEDEKKQALAQFDNHAIAAEDIKKQNELIKKDPNNPDPQLKVIQNYISLGSTEQADKLADQVIASHPTWSPAYSYKAKIQADAGNYSFGVDILNKGIEQNPADPTLYNNRASIKSQSGDFQGAIQDIDTGLKFAKNPHLLENMWVQKAIIFKKLLDASDKPDAEKMIEQIYGKHNPHLDQTNKEFFLEKYQEAFNEANKYATANKEAPVVQSSVTPNTSANIQPMNELEAAKTLHNQQVVAGIQKSGLDTTQEKIKAQAELTNKIINPDKPLTNYVLEYAKEHGEQVVEGVKQFAKGADPELEQDLFKRSKITPAHQALDMLLGGATTAFGVASLTSPEVAGFNIAASAAPEKLNEWAFGSATSIADALGYKPTEGSIGEKALKTADLLVPLLVLHKAGKGEFEVAKIETVEEKLKNGQELSKEDAPIIAEVLKTEATNVNLKDAIEASGKVEPIETPAKEETKAPAVEEKPVPAMENKVEPEVNPESKILSEAHPKESIDFAKQIIDDGWFNARGERMESRPDLGLSGAEIIKGIEDIKNDKNTVPAQKIINKLSEIKAKGEMPMIRGTGGLIERHGISLEEFEKQKQEIPQTLSEEDIKLADSIPDEAAKTINEFGITKDNIDEITKAWGFPKEEVEQIKQYLNESTESETPSTTEATPVISESEKLAQATIPETPKESIRGQDKIATGISSAAREKMAAELGTEATPSGEGWTGKEALDRGRELLAQGIDPTEMINDKNIELHDKVAIAQAHVNELGKEANAIGDKFGINSKKYKEAIQKQSDYLNKVKPLSTKSHLAFAAHQGEVEIDTGSWAGIVRAFKEKHGSDLTPRQEQEAKGLSKQVKESNVKYEELQKKYTAAMDKWAAEQENAVKEALSKERTKDLSKQRKNELKQSINDRLAKLSNVKYFAENASDRTNIITEVGGLIKDIAELGGLELVDAIKQVIEKAPHLKKFIDENQDELTDKIKDLTRKELEEKNVARLEKQLEDLQQGKIKDKLDKRELSEKEKELKEQIFEEKRKLGLIEPKKMPLTEEEKNVAKAEAEKIEFERITTQFVDKKDSKFTPEEVKDIWNHAKREYLDKNKTYAEMVRGVSLDLGLTSKQVQDALAQPKGARVINDEMYRTQRQRTQAISNAKYFVEMGNIAKWKRFIPFSKTSIWSSFFFQKSVFAHTGVGMQTHAGMNIYDPTQWKNYFGNYIQQFKNLSKVEYEKSMENLKNDPEYIPWLRAGLDIDPEKGYSEYEAKPVLGVLGKAFKSIGEAGNRGFGALKTFRFKLAKDYYEGLSEVEKADPNTRKNLAQYFNNSTGAAEVKPNALIRTLVFAPKLIGSRWNRLIIQPAKAIEILADWKNATPSEKAQVKITSKRAGIELATLGSLLALNQGLLIASGSKTRVNFTNPDKPDWMRFRFGNTAVDLSGGMVGTAQFVARIFHDIAPWTTQADLKGKTRREAIEIAVGNYGFNTISPVTSSIAEPVLRHDFNGNTVPWSDEKPLYKTAHKLTWKEYLWQQAPIPAAEAAKDMYQSMRDSGMNELQTDQVLTGIMKGVIAGGTGARVMELNDKKK